MLWLNKPNQFLPRYAVYATDLCLSVCLSVPVRLLSICPSVRHKPVLVKMAEHRICHIA